MKALLYSFFLLVLFPALNAQDKYFSKTGHVWFYSHTPMEDIEAHNRQVGTILNVKTGELAFTALIKSFEFQKALMQEHFNENYMESDKFPKSSFSGKILDIETVILSKDGKYPVKVEGDLTIHGVTKKVSTPGSFEVKAGKILATSQFHITPGDYGIEIPSVVKEKIAKDIQVNVEINYEPYK